VPVLERSEGGSRRTPRVLFSHDEHASQMAKICGPAFDDLPLDHSTRVNVLSNAEKTLRIFYKMVEEILTLKEEEERAWQEEEA